MAAKPPSRRQSIDDIPTARRHSSTSSLQSVTTPGTQSSSKARRRQPTRGAKPTLAQSSTLKDPSSAASDSVGPHDGSSMRHISGPPSVVEPITYTPTTHRISKAKKGKRVHACEFPGCNKVFTRAEHRRRHELNHSPEASFPCKVSGCRKAFHRPDLLNRHMERHDLEGQGDSSYGGHGRQGSLASTSDMMSTTTSAESPGIQGVTQPSSTMSIGALVRTPPSQDLGQHASLPSWAPLTGHPRPVGIYQEILLAQSSGDDSLLHSSSDSSQSPMSDYHTFYPRHRHSTSSATSVGEPYFHQSAVTPPLAVATTTSGWQPIVEPSLLPPHAITDHEGSLLHSVEPTVPIPLSNLDGVEWYALRRELGSAPGVVPGDDGMEIFDTVKWQDCFDLYWRHFHPLFPVVHRPTFFATKPSPLMAGAMVAIGSQYDTRPNAKEYSLACLEACSKLLLKRDTINSRSRITDIQTVFLLEMLSKFRSRRAEVTISPRFRSLYGSLVQDRHWIYTNPLAVFKTLRKEPKSEELRKAHKFWVECETRRRVLQASFILDTQQTTLFAQQPAVVKAPVPRLSSTDSTPGKNDMPFPCDSNLWESSPIDEWSDHAKIFDPITLPTATGRALQDQPPSFDPFQSSLIFSHVLLYRVDVPTFEETLNRFRTNLSNTYSSRTRSRALFTYHALLSARNVPLHALLTVSGESWIFNKKLSREADFRTAKEELRGWVDTNNDAPNAVWHAAYVLRIALSRHTWSEKDQPTAVDDGDSEDLDMVHEQWSIYIAALVCWAYGFSPPFPSRTTSISMAPPMSRTSISSASSSSGATSTSAAGTVINLLDPAEAEQDMWAYLLAMDVESWEDIDAVDEEVKKNTKGLLEHVRTRRMGGALGGLLNEAEMVLYRLVEGRSKLSHF